MLLPNSLSAQAKLLVVSPIHITPSANGSYFYDCCASAAEKKTRALAPLYRQLAERHRCFFFDAAVHAQPGSTDGMHLEADGHRALGLALADAVQNIFSEDKSI